MTTEKFKRQLDELRTIIWEGVACFWAWRELLVEDEELAKGLNRYRAFFLPTRHCLRQMTLLQFAKVFDRDPRTVSLRNLLTEAVGDHQNLSPHATDEELAQIVAQVAENETLLNRLKGLRDQRIAHYDAIRATDGRGLMPDEVQKLMEEIVSMYNALSRGHDRNITCVNQLKSNAKWHTSEVVHIIREDMERDIQRLRDIGGS